MKRTLIVGNWKMHLNVQQSSLLVRRLHQHIDSHNDVEVVLSPSLLTLQPVSLELDRRRFRLASQNANATDEGALTGEVSFAMLQELVHYGIIGHSERRIHFNETLEVVRDKVQAAVRNGIAPIVCVGETQTERNNGETKRVITDEVTTALANLTAVEIASAVVAYEPIWAIGTGTTAKPAAVAEVVRLIRQNVASLYGDTVATELRVLYGGSVDTSSASDLLAIDGIDGFLVGGASLNYQEFSGIVAKAHQHNLKQRHASES